MWGIIGGNISTQKMLETGNQSKGRKHVENGKFK